jgi:hypothetical protein
LRPVHKLISKQAMIAQYVCPRLWSKGDAILFVAQQVATAKQLLEEPEKYFNRSAFGIDQADDSCGHIK